MCFARCMLMVSLFLLPFGNSLLAKEYTVAVRAHKGIELAKQLWQPTVDFLNENAAGDSYVLLPVSSLNEISERAMKGQYDFVLTNPSSFVEINKLSGAKALVTLNNKRSNTKQNKFGSVIFTHAKNIDIQTIGNLKGKTLMAVSEQAFGGWRVAWLEMLENDFNPYKELGKLVFTKSQSQPEVVKAVQDGLVQVGVVRTDLLERMEKSGDIDMRYFRIINNKNISGFPFFLSTKLYPEWAFSASKHITTKHAKRIKGLLLSIASDSHAAEAGKYAGWIEPIDYSSVDLLMKRLKVGPYESGKKRNR